MYWTNSNGVKQNYAEALRWFRKAAGQGNAHAQAILEEMYEKGEGVKQDWQEAYFWYRLSVIYGGDIDDRSASASRLAVKQSASRLTAKQKASIDNRVKQWRLAHPNA